MIKRLYMAGPLFSTAERAFNVELAGRLITRGYTCWVPQWEEPRELTPESIFKMDVEGVDWADAVVACMDGPDPDSGTCFECGYAFGKKPIIAYRTDFRNRGDIGGAKYNLMLWASATKRVEIPIDYGVSELAINIDMAIKEIEDES